MTQSRYPWNAAVGGSCENAGMPTYQYRCSACDAFFEVVQSFTDDALTTCEECGGALRKVFSGVGVVFKGSGFYRTDSRSGSGTSSASSSDSGSAPSATPAKSDSGSPSGTASTPASGSSSSAATPAS